jgi:WD40 repeat protein
MNEVDDDLGHQPVSVLLMYDVDHSRVVRSYELKGAGGRHHFNHVVVDGKGIAYVSNTLKSAIYTVDTKDPKGSLNLLIEHEDLSWVHGIDLSPDDTKLFTTSYEGGIRILDLRTKKFFDYKQQTTAGDDGLKYYRGSLYGVGQNSIKKYSLDEAETKVIRIDTLLEDHAYFNDPRCLHIVDGVLYCLANIDFEPATFRDGKHPPRDRALTDSFLIRLNLKN